MLPVLLYTLAWIVTFYVVVIKKKNYGFGGLVVCAYLASALFSVYFIQNLSSYAQMHVDIHKMKIQPFCFVFANIMLCIYPLIRYNKQLSFLKINVYPYKKIIRYLVIVLSPFVIYAFVSLCIHDMNLNSNALADMYSDTSEGKDTFAGMDWLGKKSAVLMSYLSYLWPIIFFTCLCDKRNKKIAVIPLLGVCCSFLISYATGARVGIFRSGLYFFIVYMLFKNVLNAKIVRITNLIMLIAVGLMTLTLALITISRFADTKDDILSWISMYAGEGVLRFSEYAWNLDTTSNGDTCFSLIKQILGLDTFSDNNLRRDYYDIHLKIPTYIFYTIIGDWYIDLGMIPTIVLSCLISFCTLKLIKKGIHKHYLSLMQVLALAIIIQIIAFGFMYYSAKTYSVQLDIVRTFIVMWILSVLRKKKFNAKIKRIQTKRLVSGTLVGQEKKQ